LKKALRKVESSCKAERKKCEGVSSSLLAAGTPEVVAESRIEDFLAATGAVVAMTRDANALEEVLTRYFDTKPPFAKKESKRHEFPDAFALLTLENWAAANSTLVLVVSHDNDWNTYIEASDRLVGITDLVLALGAFQDEAAAYSCREILQMIRNGDPLGIGDAIKGALQEQQDKIDVSVQADSQFSVDDEYSDVSIEYVGIQDLESDSAIEAVEFDGQKLVGRILISAVAHMATHFTFAKWDSVDSEYIPMGSSDIEHDENVTLEVLVTFSGRLPRQLGIETIEVVPETINAEFNDLQPDWMNDRSNYDTE
jgi:hypothetical protein